MDSGSAVPTLRPGFNETVAAKVLTRARGRWGGAPAGSLASSGRETVVSLAPSEFMLIRSARFLAADNAGKSSAAITAMTTTTISNSIRVKAREGIFIGASWVNFQHAFQHARCQAECHIILRVKRLVSTTPGTNESFCITP